MHLQQIIAMNLVKPHLPKITQDLSFEFEADDPHPQITHDIEFDITLEKLDDIRKGIAATTTPTTAPVPSTRKALTMQLSRKGTQLGRKIVHLHREETIGSLLTRGAESLADVLGLSPQAPLIQKPPGEPGRPWSGGYNIEHALGWAADDYEDFEVSIALFNA